MFLFEGYFGRILYTGDFRLELRGLHEIMIEVLGVVFYVKLVPGNEMSTRDVRCAPR